ncbi:hypothetical protein OG21DRAFT_1425699, partial [Imleria badia]
ELVIEVRKTCEGTDCFERGRWFPIVDSNEFLELHFNLSLANDHSQEFHPWGVKGTLGEFQGYSVCTKSSEDAAGSGAVEGDISIHMDGNIIHIDLEPSFSDNVGEDIIHECLECRGSIAKPEEHYGGFEETKRCDEGGLPLVLFLDADVVTYSIFPTNVEFGE